MNIRYPIYEGVYRILTYKPSIIPDNPHKTTHKCGKKQACSDGHKNPAIGLR